MRGFFLLSLFWSGVATGTTCGTTSCYDYCTSGFTQVAGDTCDTTYNFEKNCYEAFGYCKNASGQNPCQGKTTSCYDYCTNSFVKVQGDTCETVYNFNESCYSTQGTCSL